MDIFQRELTHADTFKIDEWAKTKGRRAIS